jgi:hypothetical protein
VCEHPRLTREQDAVAVFGQSNSISYVGILTRDLFLISWLFHRGIARCLDRLAKPSRRATPAFVAGFSASPSEPRRASSVRWRMAKIVGDYLKIAERPPLK